MAYTSDVDEARQSVASVQMRQKASVHTRLDSADDKRGRCDFLFACVQWEGCGNVVIEGHYSPSRSGFEQALLLVPEHRMALFGAGRQALSFAFAPEDTRLVYAHELEVGFWGWVLHGDAVIMLAELEFAVWGMDGLPKWSRFVEPPWTFEMRGTSVLLDVMGHVTQLDLSSGRET